MMNVKLSRQEISTNRYPVSNHLYSLMFIFQYAVMLIMLARFPGKHLGFVLISEGKGGTANLI